MWFSYPVMRNSEKWSVFLKACVWIYFGNIIGILFYVILLQLAGVFDNHDMFKYANTTLGTNKIYLIGEALKLQKDLIAKDYLVTIVKVFFFSNYL